MNAGILYATGAYVAWGLLPLYFRQVAEVPALEVVAHRTLWALVVVLGLLAVRKQWAWLAGVRAQPRVLAAFAVSALLLSGNWLTYVWAVQNQHVVDASLGYFILPLVNLALGFAFLRERPRRGQWLAVAVATAGVLWLAVQSGKFPWIALVLALSFGIYGLLRKIAVLGALEGLALETMMLAPVAALALGWWTVQGQGALAHITSASAPTVGWLVLAGPLTAAPLLMFAAGVRRISLTTLGILQYISPSIQLLLGVWVFGEAFESVRMLGFALIWTALLIYSAEGWLVRHQRHAMV